MREILFRGKQHTDKVWVEGGVSIENDKTYICRRARYRPDTRDWDTAEYYENNPHYTRALVEIVPETLSQFTGLFDKNDKKIFEGDIVKTKYGRLCIVVWFSSRVHNGWDLKTVLTLENCMRTRPAETVDLYAKEYLEVVGNIYDNPEMLGDK